MHLWVWRWWANRLRLRVPVSVQLGIKRSWRFGLLTTEACLLDCGLVHGDYWMNVRMEATMHSHRSNARLGARKEQPRVQLMLLTPPRSCSLSRGASHRRMQGS